MLCRRSVSSTRWQSFRQTGGLQDLFAWEPLAPAGFVAMGMAVTTRPPHIGPGAPPAPKPPALNSVRCVPESWVEPAPAPTTADCVWKNRGASGQAGSAWVVNSMGLVALVAGHAPPKPIAGLQRFWNLKANIFTLEKVGGPPGGVPTLSAAN
jgi:hypothetical protein